MAHLDGRGRRARASLDGRGSEALSDVHTLAYLASSPRAAH
jgi:hypothetical protein